MAENENFNAPEFEPVAAKTPTPGSASRESKGGTLFKTGRLVTNASGAEEVVRLAIDRGVDVGTCRTSFGRMAGTDLCSIYLHPHDKPGTADVHRNKNSFTFYLHSLLEQYPELRPITNQKCKLTRTKDKNGVDCLVFHATGGLAKRTLARDDSSSSGTQSAGGEKK